jgi:cobaltochelatase CobS
MTEEIEDNALEVVCIDPGQNHITHGSLYYVNTNPEDSGLTEPEYLRLIADDTASKNKLFFKYRFKPSEGITTMQDNTVELNTPSGRACPKCSAPTLWRKGRYSVFHGCSTFPKCYGKIGAPRGSAAAKAKQESQTQETQTHTAENIQVQQNITTGPSPMMPASDALGQILWSSLSGVLTKQVQDIVAQCKIAGTKVEWTVNDTLLAKVEGSTHKMVHDCLKRIKANIKNILLVGPAGCGKTQLASDLAKSLGYSFGSVSCTAGMPEWHLVGRSTPNLTTGGSSYQASEFVTLYENGGVVLLDELDAADPNTLLVMNTALSNGFLSLPARTEKPRAIRHPNFILIGAANTMGYGATRQYVGRNQLDASTLSRFACAVIEMDYDRALEELLVQDTDILQKVWSIRDKALSLGLRQIVGTRELLSVAALVASGESLSYATKAMTVSWTPDERSKVGI